MKARAVELRTALLAPVTALLVALLAFGGLVLAYGESPWRVLRVMVEGTWGNPYGVGQVLFKATPLIFTGLAVAIPFRAGLFNIGAEGQVVMGALVGALIGMWLPGGTPWLLAIPLVAACAAVAGGAWGAVPGALKARFGAHEVITTIMLNFVALALVNYLVGTHFHEPETLHTAPIVEGARLSRLGSFIPALHGSAANTALVWALIGAGLVGWLLFRTPLGYEIRAVGLSRSAAEYGGISLLRVSTVSMAIGGACAGLVGVNFVQGYKYYFEDGFSGGVGFMGIAVALLGRNHPLGVVLAALLFGTLSQGGLVINALVPKEIVEILQAVIILVVVVASREVRAVLLRSGGGR